MSVTWYEIKMCQKIILSVQSSGILMQVVKYHMLDISKMNVQYYIILDLKKKEKISILASNNLWYQHLTLKKIRWWKHDEHQRDIYEKCFRKTNTV